MAINLIKQNKCSQYLSDLLEVCGKYIEEHASELIQDIEYLTDVSVTINLPTDTDKIAVPSIAVNMNALLIEPEILIDIQDKYTFSKKDDE